MDSDISVKARYLKIKDHLDERSLRVWVGNEALALGWGGVSKVSEETGVSRNTIAKGCEEIGSLPSEIITGETKRIRKVGGGRKTSIHNDNALIQDLHSIIEPFVRGDPMSPLLWTTKSLRDIADALEKKGHSVSFRTVGAILHALDFSLQSNRKTHEGKTHEDRDAQFLHIYSQCNKFISENQPVISVDVKKKELIGNLKNNGKVWRQKGDPIEVNVYDFPSMYSNAIPHGIYDIANNQGWITVGIDHDTSSFAVSSIRNWWRYLGSKIYPDSKKLLITADCGGSNGYRVRLWKKELQNFANEENLAISVCHLPPGTSKWNKIEHRLFSFISMSWKGQPLVSYQFMINLICSTKTRTGLNVQAILDENMYPRGVKISDDEMKMINLDRDQFHGEWNYTISPN